MASRSILPGGLLVLLASLAGCGGGGGAAPAPAPSPAPAPLQPQKTLAVAIQPSGAVAAGAFATQPVIQVRSNGNTDTTDNATVVSVTLVAGTGSAGARLSGTTTATAAAGVASFANLAIDTAGTGYQLRFSATRFGDATSSGFDVSAAPSGGGVITPGTPPASDVNFAIDSAQDAHPISRFIYGMNGWDPAQRPFHLALSRSGGNRMTAYDWETNDSNAGADYFNQNDSFLGGGSTPNGAVKPGLEAARNAGAGMIVTVPMIGYVAADHAGGGDVANTPNYLAVRFRQSVPRKAAAFALTPDTGDAFVYQDEYVNFLDKTYPGAFASASTPLMIDLDNEPDLWQSTHARLRGDANPTTQHGNTATYAEMIQRTTDYASAIKDVNPAALVLGPVNYGWQGMIRFQDAADANNRDFLEFYLAQMKAKEATAGHRLVDVMDVHWYPEAQGASSAAGGKSRITEENTEPGVVSARKQAPRSLWDPTYTEDSWITQYSTNGPIRLLPRLFDKIAANYPGTKLSITEYNYGGAAHISGAIAQADVLGIFGREGLFAATLWRLASDNGFIYGGFDMYRNFDGANGSFGDTSIRATTSDVANATVYASVDAANAGRMVLVCINKNDAARSAGIVISHTVQFHTARVYQLTGASSAPQRLTDINLSLTNALQFTMPANSVSTLVLVP